MGRFLRLFALFFLACLCTFGEKESVFSLGVESLIEKAKAGNTAGQIKLGEYYLNGIIVSKNEKEAFKWFLKAAKSNNSEALYNVGICYINGIGVNQDESKGVEYMRKAARLKNKLAVYNLGVCYANGIGLECDNAEAYALFSLIWHDVDEARQAMDMIFANMTPEEKQKAQTLKNNPSGIY